MVSIAVPSRTQRASLNSLLMMRLMAAMEIFTAQQQEDIKDEDEREARENVKREQDEAYRLSLEADRAEGSS